VESFSTLLKKAREESLPKGVKFGTDGPHITHLLFADDSIVFLEATVDSLNTLKQVLTEYEASSGQKVNLQKSSVFFGEGCDQAKKAELKQIIGVSEEALNERYLGLPTAVGRSKNGCFQYVTERSHSKAGGWKGQGLSKKGKEILVKSVRNLHVSLELFPSNKETMQKA
jgi:hypothetical protein